MRPAILTAFLLAVVSGCGNSASGTPPATAPASSGASTPFIHRLWHATISPNADSAPAYLPHVPIGHGRHAAVVYTLAANNTDNCNPGNPVRRATLTAFNAGNGQVLWRRSTTGPSRCSTAGPVVDPTGKWVYAVGLDGKLHRYASGTGVEMIGRGWPETYTLMPNVEKASATPTIDNKYIYVTTSGFIGDQGHYEGHLVSINLATGQENVFNTLCSNIHALLGPAPGSRNYCPYVTSGLFGRGNGVIDPRTGNVWIASGNGPWNGKTNWGDSVLELNPAGTRIIGSFTPGDQAYLGSHDLDLGSTGPAILPAIKRNSRTYHLVSQGGKGPGCSGCRSAAIYLLDVDQLRRTVGKLGGELGTVSAPGGSEILTAGAVWISRSKQIWVYYANDSGITGYRLAGSNPGNFRLVAAWHTGRAGTTPVISAGDLYVAHNGAVDIYRLTDHKLLGSAPTGNIHWEYPLVVGHHLYMTDESGHLTAYAVGT